VSIGHHCRVKAAEVLAKAQDEHVPTIKAEWENLARAYLRLAQQADRNPAADTERSPKLDLKIKR